MHGARRQPAGDHGAATLAVLDPNPPTVRFEDLAAQWKPEARTSLLRRVERQQGATHDFLGEPSPSVEHLDEGTAIGGRGDPDGNVGRAVAGLRRVLEQVLTNLLK